jgi:hypothetical protein
VNTLLSWLVPPLIGAVIGWVTNAIAIKMLFRPLEEIRLFGGKEPGRGIRVPFTPGILPRERKKLAASIGSMVERELLTPEILRERLHRESVRAGVKEAVAALTASFLEKPPEDLFRTGAFSPEDPPGGAGPVKIIAEKIWPRAAECIAEFLKKPEIRQKLIGQGREIIDDVRENKLSVFQRFFVEAGNYDQTINEKMPEIIDGMIARIEKLLSGRDIPQKLIAAFRESSPASGAAAGPAGTAAAFGIDGGTKGEIDGFIAEKILAAADRSAGNLLAALDVKKMVEDRINSLEMIRVEKIVLDVMANQFKWINLFGAVLGALIGLAQAAFSQFMQNMR